MDLHTVQSTNGDAGYEDIQREIYEAEIGRVSESATVGKSISERQLDFGLEALAVMKRIRSEFLTLRARVSSNLSS